MRDVGMVVVTYNSQREIGLCLDAALATGAELVVVDNASQDGTVAEAARRGVRVLANTRNRGFRRRCKSRICALLALPMCSC